MELFTPDYNLFVWVFLLPMAIFLIPYIFFIRTQYSTLEAIQPENRFMKPFEVWLQLIPVFGLLWQFVVVGRIADSIQRQYQEHKESSFLGIGTGDLQEMIQERVTYTTGFSYSVLLILSFIPVIGFIIGIPMLILWITYWRQLIKHRDNILESGL